MPKGVYQHKKGIKHFGSGIYPRTKEMKIGKNPKSIKNLLKGRYFWKGKKFSEEHLRKLRENKKGMLGKHHSKETLIKMSRKQSGQNNPAWKGGIWHNPYSVDWTETLRRSIRERDNYICRLCNQYGWMVHHIDYNKKNCNPENLITLCRRCHLKTNHNRDYWIKIISKL